MDKFVSLAKEKSAFGFVNWQQASKNDSKVYILADDAQDLPVVDPAMAASAAVGGAGGGMGAITREELQYEELSIICQLRARHVLVKRTLIEDAAAEGTVNVTELVNRRAAALVAHTVDQDVMAAVTGAPEIEHETEADVPAELRELIGTLEAQGMKPTHLVLSLTAKGLVRAAATRENAAVTMDEIYGLPVSYVDDATMAGTLGMCVSAPYFHAAVFQAAETETLRELYAGHDMVGFGVRMREGVKVLKKDGTLVPAVKWVDNV